MRVFKTRWFAKFAYEEDIRDEKLREAVRDIEAGKIDANLGGGVIKQRIARHNSGKSSGYRVIIMYRKGDKAFFVSGFAKNERDNIDRQELKYFKELAKSLFAESDARLAEFVKCGEFEEVNYHG